MDPGKLIGEVARRHQVLLDPDDPVLVMGTVSEMAMEPTVERMQAIAREVQATVAQCAGLVREIRGAVPGITREVGDRFLDHHTHYTTAATRRTALIYTVIVLAFGALCGLGGWVLRYRLEPPAPVATVNCVAVPQQRGEQGLRLHILGEAAAVITARNIAILAAAWAVTAAAIAFVFGYRPGSHPQRTPNASTTTSASCGSCRRRLCCRTMGPSRPGHPQEQRQPKRHYCQRSIMSGVHRERLGASLGGVLITRGLAC